MEARPNGADGEDPHHAEQAGADNREEGGKERTPHPAQGGSGNLVAAGQPLEGQDEVHACHAIGNDGL